MISLIMELACNYSSSKHLKPHHEHAVTGDLQIIEKLYVKVIGSENGRP